MGMNYYHYSATETRVCSDCGSTVPVKRHIGKSSGGWCFTMHVGDDCPEDWKGWLELLRAGGTIKDEDGDVVSLQRLINVVTERTWKRHEGWTKDIMRKNGAEDGPNGLMRHEISRHCIGHGEGTWDYCVGVFS